MSRTLLAVLALAALTACGRRDRQDVAAADSLNRDLQLAPVDTSTTLNPNPAADTAAATPAPEPAPAPAPKPAAPKPKPKPAAPAPAPKPAAQPAPAPAPAPASRELAAGTTLSAVTDAEIRSNKNKVGDKVTATLASDVKDASGNVVVPKGSQVTLTVTAIKESENKRDTTGTLTLDATDLTVNGKSYPITASISGVKTKL
jgi:outer membrane biosynthesis protein TonB